MERITQFCIEFETKFCLVLDLNEIKNFQKSGEEDDDNDSINQENQIEEGYQSNQSDEEVEKGYKED